MARHVTVDYGPLISFVELFTVTQKAIRVGIVGASAEAGWARLSHVPAINGLPGLKLVAVATRNERSAREAAEAFGADRWFSDPFAMIRDDIVDIVTIAVKVPAHRELVLAALDAGKAVYCEAPLGRTVAETEEMARAAGSLHTAIGLQGRLNPAVRRAAQLLSSGRIGRPLNARIVATTVGFGPQMLSTHEYFNDPSSGANLLTVTAGHTLDLVEAVLGVIVEVDAREDDLAHIEKNMAVARYELTIQTAFREVSDALNARETYRDQRNSEQALVAADAEAYGLAEIRFRSGVDSYLTALDAQRSLYAAQQQLVAIRQADLANQVTLYKTLGGGWAQHTAAPR